MKRITLTLLALLFAGASAMAQDQATAKKEPTSCQRNTAFYRTYEKSGNYKDAYTFWKKVYDECPDSSKDVYIIGARILKKLAQQAETPADKDRYANELMEMYDNRIKYFGNDPDTGEDFVLASKVSDYIELKGNEANYGDVYNWLKGIVAKKGIQTDPLALSYYAYSSMHKMMSNPNDAQLREQYVKDYMMISGYYEQLAKEAQAAGNADRVATFEQYKTGLDSQFAASGAADCQMLQKIYAGKLAENKTNKDYLQNVIVLLRRVGCNESPLYYEAADYIYAIEPSAEAAIGLARQAMSRKDYARATRFYEEAVQMSKNAEEKSEAYYNMAVMAYDQKQYSRARQLANSAIASRSDFGAPLLLIAQMYAATAPSIYPGDPILQRIVYCLVVDKCARARAIDPSVASEANKLIATYSGHFPKKEDVFMHPDINEGDTFHIGGWIGESTTVRCTN